jgi:hypothetical protein
VAGTSGVKAKKSGNTAALTPDEGARISALMRDAKVEQVGVDAIRPDPRNARRHPPRQVAVLAESIRNFGFTNPVLVDETGEIIAGHGRHAAAVSLGLAEILIIRLTHLSPADKRALALADNKIAELGSWDPYQLKETLTFLVDPTLELSFDLGLTGFDSKEIKSILEPGRPDPADQLPSTGPGEPEIVTRIGDKWLCGEHALVCHDPLKVTFQDLSSDSPAVVAFVDPFLSLELDSEEIAENMLVCCEQVVAQLSSGARIYWFTNWQQVGVLAKAVQPVIGAPKDVIVWIRSDARPGTFYQSRYDQVALLVAEEAATQLAVPFKSKGRSRTNVWQYQEADHPAARHLRNKPVALIADVLRDCSRPGDLVLDPFAGAGATIIAAERTRRRARLIESDPAACDLIVRRWQTFTGKTARLAESSATFAEVAQARSQGRKDAN